MTADAVEATPGIGDAAAPWQQIMGQLGVDPQQLVLVQLVVATRQQGQAQLVVAPRQRGQGQRVVVVGASRLESHPGQNPRMVAGPAARPPLVTAAHNPWQVGLADPLLAGPLLVGPQVTNLPHSGGGGQVFFCEGRSVPLCQR